jgi:hypothetical protein
MKDESCDTIYGPGYVVIGMDNLIRATLRGSGVRTVGDVEILLGPKLLDTMTPSARKLALDFLRYYVPT